MTLQYNYSFSTVRDPGQPHYSCGAMNKLHRSSQTSGNKTLPLTVPSRADDTSLFAFIQIYVGFLGLPSLSLMLITDKMMSLLARNWHQAQVQQQMNFISNS